MAWPRLAAYCISLAFFFAGAAFGQEPRRSGIGLPARWNQLVLPGSELEVVPGDRKDSVVLRIVASYPHGTAYRYDLEYYGLDPGTFDLRKYLRRKHGASVADLPNLPVAIEAKLPPGQITPHALTTEPAPWLGGYRLTLWLGGAVWVGGLAAILFWGRKKRTQAAELAAKPRTLADRLRPLVEKARVGQLTQTQRAELERTLLAYWRVRLELAEMKPTEAFAELRRHSEAGPLLTALENWLHRPGSSPNVDVSLLLEPYRNLPAETLEAESVGVTSSGDRP